MPLDPYFTSNGAKLFTCAGTRRAIYSANERTQANAWLSTSDRIIIFDKVKEKRARHERLTRAELLFYHTMKRRKDILTYTPLHLSAAPRRST